MAGLNGRVQAALPTVNLVTLVAAVAVLWWRTDTLETTVAGLRTALVALQVEVAAVAQQLKDRP